MKIFRIDTETTGLNPKQCGIIEIAIIVEIDDKVLVEYQSKMLPFPGDEIKEDALKINGIDIEKIKIKPQKVCEDILSIINDSFRISKEKIILSGHNVAFDKGFLYHWFMKNGMSDEWFSDHFDEKIICTRKKAEKYFLNKADKPENYKLTTLTDWFKIEHDNAHSAWSDMEASRRLDGILDELQ